MDETQGIRRSGRRRIRPVEYWNFEKPEDSVCENISYNVSLLSKCSIFDPLSTKYKIDPNSRILEGSHTKNVSKRKTVKAGKEKEFRNKRGEKKSTSVKDSKTVPAEKGSSTSHKQHGSSPHKQHGSSPHKQHGSSPHKQHGSSPHKQHGSSLHKQHGSSPHKQHGSSPHKQHGSSQVLSLLSMTASSIRAETSQNQMCLEPPSFMNIITSTILTSPAATHRGRTIAPREDDEVFKIPKLPAIRRRAAPRRLNSVSVEPSIVSIPEEVEEREVLPRGPSEGILSTAAAPGGAVTAGGAQLTSSRISSRGAGTGQDQSTTLHSETNVSTTCRRSSRIRTKPLEHWNFEKIEVKTLENGQVSVIHSKQDILQKTVVSTQEYNQVNGSCHIPQIPDHQKAQKERGTSGEVSRLPELNMGNLSPPCSTSVSPSKRKLFSHAHNFLDNPEGSTEHSPSKLQKLEKDAAALNATVMRFNDLKFCRLETDDYKCYVSRGLCESSLSLFTGFMFLEQGIIIWNTTVETNIVVIEGCGSLMMAQAEKTSSVSLKPKFKCVCASGTKISVAKGGRCKMLKICIVLGSPP